MIIVPILKVLAINLVAEGISSASHIEFYNDPQVRIHVDRGQGDIDYAEDNRFFDLLSCARPLSCEWTTFGKVLSSILSESVAPCYF